MPKKIPRVKDRVFTVQTEIKPVGNQRTEKMDDSLKEVLFKHWNVLIRYINPTEMLINNLVEDKVLPVSMIDDVKKGTSRKEKNERLLKALKLRGNMSFRKFRDVMMKCGQVFVADLLFEDDSSNSPLIEEGDFLMIPALKLSLSPDDLKRLTSALDSKVKYRLLKTDWRNNSNRRLEALQSRMEELKMQHSCKSDICASEAKIKSLKEEINAKNDLVRSISLEVNVLNHDISSFHKRHRMPGHVTTHVNHNNETSAENKTEPAWHNGRFRSIENSLLIISQRLKTLLGDSMVNIDGGTTLAEIDTKTKQVQDLVRELESKHDRFTRDRDEGLELLLREKNTGYTFLQGVQKYLLSEQKNKGNLLKSIDNLSRKLRGMSRDEPNSGLKALRQSAVTGVPSPEIIDNRFLSNHVALIEADADHMAKKLSWKDIEITALRSEVINLRKRYMCRKGSPEFTPTEIELGD